MTDRPAPTLETLLGTQVRALRLAHDMTIADLAHAAELSPGMVSKVENGQTSPSLATLAALATALNMPLSSFFTRFDQRSEATFVKAGGGTTIERRGSSRGHRYQLLGHKHQGPVHMEPALITLDEGSKPYPAFQHEGMEFLFMLEGEVVYGHGQSRHLLQPGDSLFFDARIAHGPLEMRALPARYLSVIVSDRVPG